MSSDSQKVAPLDYVAPVPRRRRPTFWIVFCVFVAVSIAAWVLAMRYYGDPK